MDLSFGKWKGYDISNPVVPATYLEWLHERMVADATEIHAELARREQAEAGNLTTAERMVVAGYRALAKEYKKDPDVMRDIEGARAALEEVLEKYFSEEQSKAAQKVESHARSQKDIRNRAYATRILSDKSADPADVAWARSVIAGH